MDKQQALENMRAYNQQLTKFRCSALEKMFVKEIDKNDYFWGFRFAYDIPYDNVDEFIKANRGFEGLLLENSEKLCFYLQHIQEYTCNRGLIRMDARSKNFSYYSYRVLQAIGSFYVFYGAKLDMQDLIYGQYRQLFYGIDFACVIACELLKNNEKVIGYCKDVLTSENNTAVLTRDVIKAIEQSHNQELQNLLTQVFLAAKLQEGLRQSVIETVDEHQIDYFISMIEVISENNLLRFSSVQRGVLTWIGIGYEIVEDRVVSYIFDCINTYIHDEEKCKAGLNHQNPINVYIALYCLGVKDIEDAIAKAVLLLESDKRHIVASALIYLKLSQHFDIRQYAYFMDQYQNDEWIMALYLDSCTHTDFTKLSLSKEENRCFFDHILNFMAHMKASQSYHSQGFEWFSLTLYKNSLGITLYELITNDPEKDMIEKYLPYVSNYLSQKQLNTFMEKYFPKVSLDIRKAFMVKEIISNSKQLSQLICDAYLKMTLTSEDIANLEARLKTKKDYARANIIQVLAKQSQEVVLSSYERLQASPIKTIQESALELKQKAPAYFKDSVEVEKIKIIGKKDGYGLYQPYTIYPLTYETYLKYSAKGLFKKKKFVDVSFIQIWDKPKVINYLKLWNERVEKHQNDEYQLYGSYYQVKDKRGLVKDYRQKSLDALVLSEVWRAYFEKDQLPFEVVYQLHFLLESLDVHFERILSDEVTLFSLMSKELEDITYLTHIKSIITYYFYEQRPHYNYRQTTCALLEIYNHLTTIKAIRQKNTYNNETYTSALSSFNFFYSVVNDLDLENANDEEFRVCFPILYESYVTYNLKLDQTYEGKLKIMPLTLARAIVLKLLPKEALMEGILDTHYERVSHPYYYGAQSENMLFEAYRDAYFKGRGVYGKPNLELPSTNPLVYQCLRETLDEIAHQLLSMEQYRLNEETEITKDIQSLRVIRGVKYLILALHVLDNENINRHTYGNARSVVFGNVVRNCYPLESDTVEMLQEANFPQERLVEVAMMAPQWIDFVNEVLQWDGFKEACYYFIAHMKQYDIDHKKAEIAKYTALDPLDLNDGAFDMDWCRRIYATLGEKRMKILYGAAKYLCENAFHTRARKYADALLGKVNKETYLKQAQEKRNKDALSAYCICPIENDEDLVTRYLYLQQFLKESKQFGAQRQTSEKRAYEIALMNLARNSRFETVTRLSWMMESQIVQQYALYLEPQTIEDIEVWIEIDEQGRNQICVSKNKKALKSIPSKYKKHEQVLKIKEVSQMWKAQYQRARSMLEEAMEQRIAFSKEEILAMAKNPIVYPMLSKLVLESDDHFGFYQDGKLQGMSEIYALGEKIKIVHAYDLYAKGVWQDFQKMIFTSQIVQPFKQVFRELYTKLDDELEKSASTRYTGYQIQPKQTIGALKNRKWHVAYEEGLEKVDHKNDLIVHLYAQADWFSPSDIEAPSIDYVAFQSRKDNRPMLIKDIDDVAFSEVMRDVDMAVSIAYVGGVDPVTSFSTVELRRAIIQYTCDLMGYSQVTLQDHFANIKGSLNTYSVHLGSGVIHQVGGPAIHIVPVYSGKRGKVYLPFLDEDPLTAQILTKVIMLAEDHKIKDPAILDQIMSR